MLKDYRYILFTAVFFLIGFLCTSCMMPIHDANDVWRLARPPPSTSPTLFEQWCGFFYVPQEPDKWKCCETGPKVFRTYPRSLERIPFADVITKAVLSSQLFKDPECWSGRGSNPWPPAQQTGALPTELTRLRVYLQYTGKRFLSK